MPRGLTTRISYQADAAFLAKLADAVQRDERFSAEKKRSIVTALNTVSIEFMNTPALNTNGAAQIDKRR